MTPGEASIEQGHLVIRRHNIAFLTSDPADSDAARESGQRFDINTHRLANIQCLIKHRHGGPVDTDDGYAYISAAFNAIAMGRSRRGWKQSEEPLIAWAKKWTPLVDAAAVTELAKKVVASPRKMSGRVVGNLVRLTNTEWQILGIKTIDPFDISPERVSEIKADRKREQDRVAAQDARRKAGSRSMDEIRATSIKAFCQRYELSERTFRYHAKKGVSDLYSWLDKKGVVIALPQDVETIDRVITLILRRTAAK